MELFYKPSIENVILKLSGIGEYFCEYLIALFEPQLNLFLSPKQLFGEEMFESSQALLFGALTFGVASVAYVIYGPSPRKKSGKGSVLGLANYGNHCFVNAVLQSLAACKSFINWLQFSENNANDHKQCFLGKQNNYCSTTPRIAEPQNKVTSCLLKTLRLLNNAENSVQSWSPIEVLDALVSHNYRIPNEEQQDAHELFNILTTTLEGELYSSLPLYSLRDALLVEDLLQSPVSEDCSPRITTRGSKSVSSNRKAVSLPTKGMLASQLQCLGCNHKKPVLLATFHDVTLNIPNKVLGGPILLQECLQKFVSSETIQDVTCEECLVPGRKVSFIRKITFGKLPQLLCFHFHRLLWIRGVLVKRTEHVNFPEFLNMDEFMYTSLKAKPDVTDQYSNITGLLGGTAAVQYSPQDFVVPALSANTSAITVRFRYRLCSVIVHLGNALSGHFITYRRGANEDEDKWYLASDSQVKRVLPREVMSSTAYMLFYERVK